MTKKSPTAPGFFRVLLVISIVIMVLTGWYRWALAPVSDDALASKIFVIPRGQNTSEIVNRLQATGLVRSALATKIFIKFSDSGKSIQAGSFRLSGALSVAEIVNSLKHGTLDVWLTFPEGWRSEQIVDKLLAEGLLKDSHPSELYKQFHQSEGRLFPDTYLFSKDSTAQQIIERMTSTFETKTSRLLENHQASSRDVLILASLVEREAKQPQDRPLIAGVLTNRLNIGMALQVDATLQYAKAALAFKTSDASDTSDPPPINWWPSPLAADKNINHPFNTYKFPGLPPDPIANPGLAALEAALNPADTDYLYYLTGADGTTHFARTLEEHQANIRRYL